MISSAVQKAPAVRAFVPFAVAPTPPRDQRTPETLVEHLDVLRDVATKQRFARNETIFQDGDRAATIFRVASGTVRLCRHTPDGRRHIADFALPGDLIGVLGGGVQAFTAEAVTDVALIAYPRAQFDRMSERDPHFRANILGHLAQTLMSAQLHTFVLGCQCAKERFASFILRLAERTGAFAKGRLDLPMGRQDIADHLGLTIETICRAVTALKNERVIGVPNTHQLLLHDADALRELADGAAAP